MIGADRPLPVGPVGTTGGFTLVEVVVVLLLGGLLAAAAVPDLAARLTRSDLDRGADELADALRSSRWDAVRSGAPVSVELTRDGRAFRYAGGLVELPGDVHLRLTGEGAGTTFYPTGSSTGGTWEMVDGRGSEITIRVSPLESSVTATRGAEER